MHRAIDLAVVLDQEVSLRRLEILEVVLPQVESFRSAVGVRRERRALYVRWFDRDGAWGLGECSCRPDPYFSGEFLDGARTVLSEFVVPALPSRGRVAEISRQLARVRDWPFTTAAVLDAIFDLLRRTGGDDPLSVWPYPRASRVPVGISLGLFEEPEQAVERVAAGVAAGYRRIKLKIAPKMNRATLEAVRAAFPDFHIGFDANGSFGEQDLDFVASLAELDPVMLEQPFAPDRLDLCRRLRTRRPGLGICLDESLTGIGSVETARWVGALDEVNLKPGRVGGPLESLRILEHCRRHQLPAWIGGMFESGVGRMANLRFATCLPDAEAHDLSPSRRYFTTDIVTEPVEMDADGFIDLTNDGPVEIDEENLERLLAQRLTLIKD